MDKKTNETKHTSYRLPPQTKSMLRTLSSLEDTTDTTVLKRLIRAEYMSRRDEIRDFRESLKTDEKLSNDELNR